MTGAENMETEDTDTTAASSGGKNNKRQKRRKRRNLLTLERSNNVRKESVDEDEGWLILVCFQLFVHFQRAAL